MLDIKIVGATQQDRLSIVRDSLRRSLWSLIFLCISCAGCSVDALHHYLWANYCQCEGNYQQAKMWYDKLFMADASVHVYKGYLMFLYETGSFDKIVGLIPIIENRFEQDADIQFLLAQALEKVGQHKQAYEKIINLAHTFTTHPEIVFQAVQIYVQRKELDNAIAALDTFLNTSPRKINNFIFYFMKAQIYLQMGNKEQAVAQVKECLDMQPGFGKGWLLLALLEEQQGRLDQAIKGYTTYLEIDGLGNKQIQQHLVELIFRQDMIQKKHEMLVMHKSSLDKALYFFDVKEYAQALLCVDQALAEKPEDNQIRLLKITILSTMKEHLQAAAVLKKWLLDDPRQEVWFTSLHLLCRTGLTYQKGIVILEDITKQHPKELLPLLYLIDIATRVAPSHTVISYYKKALELAPDADLKVRLYFHLAHIYYRDKKYDQVRQTLEKAHTLGVDFPHVQNMLAYYYATGSRDLERAQKLMDSILVNHKTNPHFQDTQAFIYYKQHKYDKALAILEPVVEKVPHNLSIIKHLGKTYFKLGMRDKAIITLKKARDLAESDHEKQKCTNILGCWSANS